MPKPWQQSLLSSGLPLESDLLSYLQEKGCIAKFHFSYLKEDEQTIEREFSYDIDASYIKHGYFMDLMVECKYRHPGTKWVFARDEYGGFRELDPTDFLNPFDHFTRARFPYRHRFPRKLGPACSKGTELLTDGTNEKSIAQAVHQLAYAMAEKMVSSMESQALTSSFDDLIFCHIPVVATTAELHRIKEGVRINDIRGAADISEIATRESCLVLNHDIGADLYRHNARVFAAARTRLGDTTLKKSLSTFTKDLDHFFSVLASYQAPRAIAFVEVGAEQNGFNQLFTYLDELIDPSPELQAELAQSQREFEELVAAMPKTLHSKKRTRGKRPKSDV